MRGNRGIYFIGQILLSTLLLVWGIMIYFDIGPMEGKHKLYYTNLYIYLFPDSPNPEESIFIKYSFVLSALNGMLFTVGGFFTLVGLKFGFYFNALGSFFYILTFDNPFTHRNPFRYIEKWGFVFMHLVLLTALYMAVTGPKWLLTRREREERKKLLEDQLDEKKNGGEGITQNE